ncbi:hypothetical protein [Rubrivirga sp. IMCC43871]|uniref:hypothetical protein n=1 Tax=Rubrivirga sp. IMCC43871 TaxID=3391575 RepID=UPI00398FD623
MRVLLVSLLALLAPATPTPDDALAGTWRAVTSRPPAAADEPVTQTAQTLVVRLDGAEAEGRSRRVTTLAFEGASSVRVEQTTEGALRGTVAADGSLRFVTTPDDLGSEAPQAFTARLSGAGRELVVTPLDASASGPVTFRRVRPDSQ